MIEILLLIFRCLSVLYSVFFNSRNTEDFVRPLWTVLLFHFCDGSSDLLPSSEFRLFTSPRDEDDPDASLETIAERNAKDVIPDFIILLPIDKETGPPLRRKQILDRISKRIDPPFLRLDRMYAPLLVELKRGPSRHHCRIDNYVKSLHDLMGAARIQVELQGNCLFSSPKFSKQKQVMIVAATGQWWSMMIYRRTDSVMFSEQQYANAKLTASLIETDTDEGDQIFSPDDEEMMEKWELITKEEEARLWEMYNGTPKLPEEQDRERAERYRRWNEIKDERDRALAKLENFIEDNAKNPFSEAEINEYYELSKKAGLMPRIPADGDFMGVAFDEIPTADTFVYNTWTLPMRIGSPVSNYYVNFIKSELNIAATKKMY